MKFAGRRHELKATIVVAVAVPLIVGAFTAAVLLIGRANGIEFWELNEDPTTALGGAHHTGFYAKTIIVVWQIGAITALFSGAVAWFAGRRGEGLMLLAGGAVGAVMGIDDFFLLHETLQVAGLSSGVPPAVYAVAVIAFTYVYRRELGWWLLLALGALVGWGTSALIDYVHVGIPLVIEDTPKAVGTVFWSVLLVKLAYRAMSGMVTRGAAAGDEFDDDEEFDEIRVDDHVAGDVATAPIPAARPSLVGRHPFTEPATVAAPGVRPRPTAGGSPGPGRHAGLEPAGHAVPLPRNGRARHRLPDD